jgi:hypothetical protein
LLTRSLHFRFELFSSALTNGNEKQGLDLLTGPIEPYLDFIPFSADCIDDSRHANLILIRSAIQAACELCAHRLRNSCTYQCPDSQLDALKQIITGLEPSVDGAHALVWTCFVAAAESVRSEHREFFSNRLAALYPCTRFNTIPQGLETLELIWKKQGKQKWTELVKLERPILIM